MASAVDADTAVELSFWESVRGSDNPDMYEDLSLYFASQGAARLFWPLFAGLLRLLIAAGGGWAVLHLTGSLGWLFAALAVALVVYGLTLAAAVASGVWFRRFGGPALPDPA